MLCIAARYEEKVLKFRLPEGESTLGSSASADLFIPYPGISRAHATAARVAGGILLRDAGSKNGIWGPQGRVREWLLLPGQSLRLGDAVLTLEEGATSDLEVELVPSPELKPGEDDHDETGSAAPWDHASSPVRALRFVREVERSGASVSGAGRNALLDEATVLLGALSIVLLDMGDQEDGAVVDFGGALPPSPFLEAAAKEGACPQDDQAGHFGRLLGWPRLSRRTEDVLVVAMFPEPLKSLEPWQVEFFAYVAERAVRGLRPAGHRPGVPAPSSLSGSIGESLVFPAGMVVGTSPSLNELLKQIRATVRSRIDVLLLGETGTGKELFARMVHASGPTANGPFVAINCAAIPSELLEAELFGVQARVATGVDARVGLFQQANGGTIFLDEIGELAAPLQAKLLRVLQEREVLPLGAPAPKKVDVRVVSASNRDLAEAVAAGQFRADLFYRLRGLQFHIPPLRERLGDLPALVLSFVERAAAAHGKRVKGISRKALDILRAHSWPGNVRELQNEVDRAVLVCPDGGTLRVEHFGPVAWQVEKKLAAQHPSSEESGSIGSVPPAAPLVTVPVRLPVIPEGPPLSLRLQEKVEATERTAIEEALRVANGNKSLAARLLGITRNGLAMKMKRLFREGRRAARGE